jgi:3-deoxy-7-phosphoheptulonate synthase
VISPQYIGDLISWGAIGARTTESQVHRELASGLSAPIGFKNGTDGNIKIATDAIQAAARGAPLFVGAQKRPSCDRADPGQPGLPRDSARRQSPQLRRRKRGSACKELEAAKLPATLMVDCSHANSSKKHERQIDVAKDIAAQISGGSRQVFGVMVESHLKDGAQKFTPGQHDVAKLTYGQSITDACIGWDDSEGVLQVLECRQSRRCSCTAHGRPLAPEPALGR